jgi:hypothetical protein
LQRITYSAGGMPTSRLNRAFNRGSESFAREARSSSGNLRCRLASIWTHYGRQKLHRGLRQTALEIDRRIECVSGIRARKGVRPDRSKLHHAFADANHASHARRISLVPFPAYEFSDNRRCHRHFTGDVMLSTPRPQAREQPVGANAANREEGP